MMRVHASVPLLVDASHSELNRLARIYSLDYNEVHPKGKMSMVRICPNSLRRCESHVLELALVIRALVGHRTCCTVILAVRLCSWTDILLFYLFDRIVKEYTPMSQKVPGFSQKRTILTMTWK